MLPGSSSLFVEYETDVNKLWCRLRSKERPSNESPLMRSQYIRWCAQVAELRTWTWRVRRIQRGRLEFFDPTLETGKQETGTVARNCVFGQSLAQVLLQQLINLFLLFDCHWQSTAAHERQRRFRRRSIARNVAILLSKVRG